MLMILESCRTIVDLSCRIQCYETSTLPQNHSGVLQNTEARRNIGAGGVMLMILESFRVIEGQSCMILKMMF